MIQCAECKKSCISLLPETRRTAEIAKGDRDELIPFFRQSCSKWRFPQKFSSLPYLLSVLMQPLLLRRFLTALPEVFREFHHL